MKRLIEFFSVIEDESKFLPQIDEDKSRFAFVDGEQRVKTGKKILARCSVLEIWDLINHKIKTTDMERLFQNTIST